MKTVAKDIIMQCCTEVEWAIAHYEITIIMDSVFTLLSFKNFFYAGMCSLQLEWSNECSAQYDGKGCSLSGGEINVQDSTARVVVVQ